MFCWPRAAFALGFGLIVLAGCEKKPEPPREPPRESPASYMNDPKFRKEIADARKELQAIAAQRAPVVARMQELVKKHGADEGKLQNVPEWAHLKRELKTLDREYKAVRQRQLDAVRDRITPEGKPENKKTVSK